MMFYVLKKHDIKSLKFPVVVNEMFTQILHQQRVTKHKRTQRVEKLMNTRHKFGINFVEWVFSIYRGSALTHCTCVGYVFFLIAGTKLMDGKICQLSNKTFVRFTHRLRFSRIR